MVSQLLLGESAQVLEQAPRWLRVRGLHDDYEGWLSITQAHPLTKAELPRWHHPAADRRNSRFLIQAATMATEHSPAGQQLWIPLGGVLPPDQENTLRPGTELEYPFGRFRIISELSGSLESARDTITRYASEVSGKKARMLETALSFLGIPYLWGGRSSMGIDCSGFIQVVLQMHGYLPPRDASQQVAMPGHEPDPSERALDRALPGDIIYFSFDGRRVVHVGFYLGRGVLLHASGMVKMEYIDELEYKRNKQTFAFNKRLATHIYAIQRLS